MIPDYSKWLGHMKLAWETKDYSLLSRMLSSKLTYVESPFLPPYTTKQQVVDEWKRGLAIQRDIHFDYDILLENENECFAHWTASFVRENAPVMLDGVFHFRLNAENTCTYFKMWWVTK